MRQLQHAGSSRNASNKGVQPVRRGGVIAAAVTSAQLAQLQAAVETVFPNASKDPENIVRRCVAQYLLEQQDYRAHLSAAAVPAKWQTYRDLCQTSSWKKLLQSTKGLVVEGTNGNDTVALATKQLLQLSQQAALSSSKTASSSSRGAASSAGIQQLQQLVAAMWPTSSSDPAVRVKRCVADLLLEAPDLTRPSGTLGQVGQLLGSAASLGLSSFGDMLSADPSGCFVRKAVDNSYFY
jgi:hypothetical protein